MPGVVGQLARLRSVLSIGKLAGPPGAGRCYTDAVAKGREDYYQGSGEVPGAWAGAGAQLLELDGRVDDEHFGALLRGVDPKNGNPLRSSRGPSRTAGFDLTLSAPKSVSVLFAIAEEDVAAVVRRAHDEAVSQALGYLEREATFTRRGTNSARRSLRSRQCHGSAGRDRDQRGAIRAAVISE
jgi:conjugative relaxase-like TrwC/TraI family protein